MISVTVDDFLLSYDTPQTRDDFFKTMGTAFDITAPGDSPTLKFLSLRIYQSSDGTSIDQTEHIESNILYPWFHSYRNHCHLDTPFPPDTTYESTLASTPSISPSDLPQIESQFHVPFNHTIGKLLHIQQWTQPDLNFAISRLAVFTKSPNKPAFESLHRLMEYLDSHKHEPIFYPCHPIGPEQVIKYNLSPTQTSTYNLPSYPTMLTDSAFANILPHHRSMQGYKLLLHVVITDWQSNIQTSIAADSTDAELKAFFTGTKKLVAFHDFLTSSAFNDLLTKPFTVFIDNQATINIVQHNRMNGCTCHQDIPIAFTHEYFTL